MTEAKLKEIRAFFEANSDPEIVKKYQRYFKDGYDGYGIDKDLHEKQVSSWEEQWSN